MSAPELLAIVEVPRDERVRCKAAGCNHPVFRRIHVVRENAVVSVYGSECFKRLFATLPFVSSLPRYSSSEGRNLTEEERQLLTENTERLIEQFEAEYHAEITRKAALAAEQAAHSRSLPLLPLQPKVPPRFHVPHPASLLQPSADERRIAEAQAKKIVRAKYNIDPELPGWRGLVLAEMQELLANNPG